MIACKEELRFFEDLQKLEQRVYGDAVDVGVKLDNELKTRARENLQRLRQTYRNRLHHGPERSSTTEVDITFEEDEGLYHGVTLSVFFFVVKKHPELRATPGEFLAISVSPRSWPTHTFNE